MKHEETPALRIRSGAAYRRTTYTTTFAFAQAALVLRLGLAFFLSMRS